MSGKNILLTLVAVLVAIGLFYLVTGPAQTPVVEAPPAPGATSRATPSAPPAPTESRSSSPENEAIDAVAADAAKEIQRLKDEQAREMMMEKPPAPEMEKRN